MVYFKITGEADIITGYISAESGWNLNRIGDFR